MRIQILFLAANPSKTQHLNLKEEAEKLKDIINSKGEQQNISMHVELQASVRDMTRQLLKLRPSVVHFSGHGLSTVQNRDMLVQEVRKGEAMRESMS